jgi:hypothetical protein
MCRTVVINLEIFTQAIEQISTGRGGAPTIRRWRRTVAKFSAAVAYVDGVRSALARRLQALLANTYPMLSIYQV